MGANTERLGPYELEGELGRGAMARVWRAKDSNLGREVALKEPLFDSSLPEDVQVEMGRRFVREAKTAARLNHPGIVTVYTADVYDGRPAIAMELVEGATIGDILEKSGKLDPASTLDALDQLLDAVGYAHTQGVVHRDIKPDNIFVRNDGRVKLGDFGIAHVENSATIGTQKGTQIGTPGYMSPEQVKGTTIDARSDLFSIGVVAYEMLTGHNPFGTAENGEYLTLLYRIVNEPPAELPNAAELSPDMRAAIMAALSKNPDDRPQTAEAFKAMLHGGAAPLPNTTPLIPPQKKGLPKWFPYVAVTGICAIALVGVFLFASGGNKPAPPRSAVTSSTAESAISASSASSISTKAYLAARDGYVAIYTNNSAEPYEITDVPVSDLSDADAANVNKNISFASPEEAKKQVERYRESAQTKNPAVHRYTFYPEACTWSEAQERAKGKGGHLATVTSQEEWDAVLAVLPPETITVCWLGANRNQSGSFAWLTGEPFTFNRWADREPNNEDKNEPCLCTLKSYGAWGWYDVPNDISPYYKPERMGYVVEFE